MICTCIDEIFRKELKKHFHIHNNNCSKKISCTAYIKNTKELFALLQHNTACNCKGRCNCNHFNNHPNNSENFFNSKKGQQITLTYDKYGMPIIRGGTFSEVWEMAGYENAKNRLWEIVSNTYRLLGRSSELTGENSISGDEYIRTIRPKKQILIKLLQN